MYHMKFEEPTQCLNVGRSFPGHGSSALSSDEVYWLLNLVLVFT